MEIRTVRDLEVGTDLDKILTNNHVNSLSFSDLTVTVKDRRTKQPLPILSSCSGTVGAGQLLALMGPSGSGIALPMLEPYRD